jgi:outer membrane receptor protein involved in Fe transport
VGASYRVTHAELETEFVEVPASAYPYPVQFPGKQDLSSLLHQVALGTTYNHSSGFFGDFKAVWYSQSNDGYLPDLPGDNFWQLNLLAGYRFPGRRVELRLGVLNLTDKDYRLNPLTLYNELPRERTFVARLQFAF